MDINVASALLFNWFESHDSYNHTLDYRKLSWKEVEDDKNSWDGEREAAVLCALNEFEKENIVSKHSLETGKGKDKTIESVWVLFNSQKNKPISVELSRETAENLCKICQQFLPFLDLDIDVTLKPEGISESEIILMLQICNVLAQQLEELQNKPKSTNTKQETGNNDLE